MLELGFHNHQDIALCRQRWYVCNGSKTISIRVQCRKQKPIQIFQAGKDLLYGIRTSQTHCVNEGVPSCHQTCELQVLPDTAIQIPGNHCRHSWFWKLLLSLQHCWRRCSAAGSDNGFRLLPGPTLFPFLLPLNHNFHQVPTIMTPKMPTSC